jgi:hypothetical protein
VRPGELLDFRLTLLDRQIAELTVLKGQLELHKLKSNRAFIERIPVLPIAQFLGPRDLLHLSLVSRHFKESLTHHNQTVLPHLQATNRKAASSSIRGFLLHRLCLASVESIHLNIHKNEAAAHFLRFLAQVAPGLVNLRSFSLVGGAASGDVPESCEAFFARLPKDKLEAMHLSGLPSLEKVGRAISSQKGTLRKVKIDYLCANHGTSVDEEVLPVIPRLEEMVMDVADLSEVKAEVMIRFLKGIKDKSKVKTLYFPHVQILGTVEESKTVVEEIKSIATYQYINQIVFRFHSLSLPLTEFYSLRESLSFLPACCLSKTFLVALDRWATWWPPIHEVWKLPSQVTARAVFKEQIDFGSLGTSSDREWLRLSRDKKIFWNTAILPKITKFWILEQQSCKPPRSA